MRSFLSAIPFVGLASMLVAAAPLSSISFPDGFPNPTPAQVKQIEQQALGTLSNEAPPGTVSPDGLINLQLIAFNELFEVAFFTELIYNITNNVKGYHFEHQEKRDFVLKALAAVQGQEELHALNANGALQHFGAKPIQLCQYRFPVSTFDEAIKLASTFTSVVLGTLQDVVQVFAENGDAGLTRAVASVIGQEGEQEGWYRLLQGKVPSELPFLSTNTRDYAFTAIQSFTVPGSCPNQNLINLKTFLPLTLVAAPGPATQNIKFTYTTSGSYTSQTLWVTYINQQNTPIVEPLHVVQTEGSTVTVEALFPYTANELNGLTTAVLTKSAGPFVNADAVVAETVFGPAFIIIN